MVNHADGWRVEDNDSDRERFTQAPKGQTESITFRAYTHHLRVLDEVIQSQIDPRLKTKSDCLQDALALFIENWVDNYSDGLSGTQLRMLRMEQVSRRRAARQAYITTWDDMLDATKGLGDKVELKNLLTDIAGERADRALDSPESHIQQLDKRIEDLKHLLDRPD